MLELVTHSQSSSYHREPFNTGILLVFYLMSVTLDIVPVQPEDYNNHVNHDTKIKFLQSSNLKLFEVSLD